MINKRNLDQMKPSNIILGAGLAGLSAAYHSDSIIYEADSTAGGAAKSINIKGFTFDLGIHVLHTKNKIILNLLNDIDVKLNLLERNAWIYSHKSFTRFPFQANTYGLPSEIIKDCLLGFIDNSHNNKENIKNYHQWLLYMFGEGFTKHFMEPYAKKFWGVDPIQLSTDWVNIRHPRPSLDEVLTGALMDQTKGFGINASFRYPLFEGYGNIANQFAKYLNRRIIYNKKAERIDLNENLIYFQDQDVAKYKKIFSTLPLIKLLNLFDNVPDSIKEASKKLKTNKFILVHIGIGRADISNKTWIYSSEKDISFVRISFPANLSKNCVPKGCSSIQVELSFGPDDNFPSPVQSVIPKVINDLIKIGILNTDDKILFAETSLIENAYVIFDHNRKSAIKKIHGYLNKKNIIPFGRYGQWAYLWSDEAIMDGRNIAINHLTN